VQDNRVRWQIDCDNTIKNECNVILSSPTGSGKTKRYEIWALNKQERPIFITAPIKSLSNQKYRDLQALGYNVGLETGDIKYIPENCDIICCTQEIYNNRYRDYENATLVIDEFSYIFEDKDRARVYVDSLFYSKAKNIIICSATFGNAKKIRDYINRVTGRNFFLYENEDRLTTLEYKGKIKKKNIMNSLVVAYSKIGCKAIAKTIYDDRNEKYGLILKTDYDLKDIKKRKITKFISKYDIKNQELIELCTMGVAYYYGSLLPKEKLFIEELFEEKVIDVVVGTDALALGVNFPIQNVVFAQLTKRGRQNEVISRNLFEQLSGRAGRKGYFDSGYVYFCKDLLVGASNNKLEELFYSLLDKQNEEVEISLSPNIKDILKGNTSIEEEVYFIKKYSTGYINFYEEEDKIENIIEYIKSFDVMHYYLSKKYPNLDFSSGYKKAFEGCTVKSKHRFETAVPVLKEMQAVFENDIGEVYLEEYTPEKNCAIFIDVLMNAPIEVLRKKYCVELRDLLLLRKYITKLPEKYAQKYDISVIDNEIDDIDHTVLHLNDFRLKEIINEDKNESVKQNKNQKVYNCPHYLERIMINGREYVILLKTSKEMLVCEYSNDNRLNTKYISSNERYKTTGFIKLKQRLELLNKVNLTFLSDEDVDKIEGMKLFLEKGMDKIRRKR